MGRERDERVALALGLRIFSGRRTRVPGMGLGLAPFEVRAKRISEAFVPLHPRFTGFLVLVLLILWSRHL